MRKIDFKSQVLPHIVAVLVFALITIAYFRPVFLENKSLNQHDIKQWEGGAKEILDYRERTGEEALWTGRMFSGMPAYLISTEWGIGIMPTITKIMSLGLPHPPKVIFLAFVSFYILLLSFGVRPYLAIAGAIAFGLSSYNIIGLSAGHNARIAAVAYMPLVLAGVHLTFRKSVLLGLMVTFLGLALELYAGHLQITYYLIWIVLGYMISEAFEFYKEHHLKSFFKRSAMLAGIAVLALGTFIGSFLSTMEYSKYSIRGASELAQEPEESKGGLTKSYAFEYSNGIWEPLVLMVPNAFGGSTVTPLAIDSNVGQFMLSQGVPAAQAEQQLQSMPTYWGNQPATSPYYAGAAVCFLFFIGLLTVKRSTVTWVVSIIIFGIVLSWGDNLSSVNYFLFDHLPGYNKFRSVTFAIIMPIFGIIFLGFLGLEKLLEQGWNKKTKKQLFTALGISGGITLIMILGAGMVDYTGAVDARLPDWLINPLHQDRKGLRLNDAIRSLGIMLAMAAIIGLWLREILTPAIAQILIILLVTIDMWVIDKRYLAEDKFNRNPRRTYFNPTEADSRILADQDKAFRVFELRNPFNEARTSYHHRSIGGYHGAKIRRYQDLISQCITNEHAAVINALQSGLTLPQTPVLNMLNTKYLVAGNGSNAVLTNANANGAAWFVDNIEIVDSPDDELAELCGLNTESSAVVDQTKFKLNNTNNLANGTIELTQYQPNKLTYTSNSSGDGFAVFSEIYYPKGWSATIDGNPAEIVRVNYVLRGLEIPGGNHTIEFEFKPAVYQYGNIITSVSTILLVLMIIGTLLIELGVIRVKKH